MTGAEVVLAILTLLTIQILRMRMYPLLAHEQTAQVLFFPSDGTVCSTIVVEFSKLFPQTVSGYK